MIGRLSPRRRRAAAEAPGAEPIASQPVTDADAQPTVVQPTVAQPLSWDPGAVSPPADPATPPPAGVELQPPADAPGVVPSFRTRGRLRRRLRYLRRIRELGFRDLGGLTFDLHRFGRDGQALIAGKLASLGTIDAELRALERALGDEQELLELREPGIAACPRCATLHGSDDHFCPNCGLHLDGPMAVAQPAAAAPATEGLAEDGVSAAASGSSPVSSGLGPLAPPAGEPAPEPEPVSRPASP